MNKVLAYFFPNRCPSCGNLTAYNKTFCDECKSKLVVYSSTEKTFCAPFIYEQSAKEAVIKLKFETDETVAHNMADEMSACIDKYFKDYDFDIVIPVPMMKNEKSSRGFNQSELLAKYIRKDGDKIKLDCKSLKKVRETKAQHTLTAAERSVNLKNAFAVSDSENISGKDILLIDDIRTTGTTVSECKRVLKRAGANEICTAVFAVAKL